MIDLLKPDDLRLLKERIMRRIKLEPCRYPEMDDCWIWQGSTCRDQYGQIRLIKRNWRTHRLMHFITFGTMPDDMLCCHKCDTPRCVNPAHLFLGTDADNNADRKAKNRTKSPKGEKSGMSKLSQSQAMEIREARARGVRLIDLAPKFGVSLSTISCIARGRTWGHLAVDSQF